MRANVNPVNWISSLRKAVKEVSRRYPSGPHWGEIMTFIGPCGLLAAQSILLVPILWSVYVFRAVRDSLLVPPGQRLAFARKRFLDRVIEDFRNDEGRPEDLVHVLGEAHLRTVGEFSIVSDQVRARKERQARTHWILKAVKSYRFGIQSPLTPLAPGQY